MINFDFCSVDVQFAVYLKGKLALHSSTSHSPAVHLDKTKTILVVF